jgi:hypothetical protein
MRKRFLLSFTGLLLGVGALQAQYYPAPYPYPAPAPMVAPAPPAQNAYNDPRNWSWMQNPGGPVPVVPVQTPVRTIYGPPLEFLESAPAVPLVAPTPGTVPAPTAVQSPAPLQVQVPAQAPAPITQPAFSNPPSRNDVKGQGTSLIRSTSLKFGRKEEAPPPEAASGATPDEPKRLTPQAPAVPPASPPLGTDTGAPCGSCEPAKDEKHESKSHFWFGADYLYWFVKDSNIRIPLASTGPASTFGILGLPGTSTVLGNDSLDFDFLHGARLNAGAWLNDCHTFGIEGGGFILFQGQDSQTAPNLPVLARPFLDTSLAGAENALLLSLPGAFAGSVSVAQQTLLWGGELTPFWRFVNDCKLKADILAGFRYLELKEKLEIKDQSQILAGGVATTGLLGLLAPSTVSIDDGFKTRNQIYGGELGARVQFNYSRWGMELGGKATLGVNHQTLLVGGTTTISGILPVPVTLPGGLLAVSSNSGKRTSDEFTVAPEATVQLRYRVTDHVSVNAGYTFLYINNVVRPAEQLDRTVNPTLVPISPSFGVPFGPARPAPLFERTDYWAHGANVGLLFEF